MCASTTWPFGSFTRNIVPGSTSTTTPSLSIESFLATIEDALLHDPSQECNPSRREFFHPPVSKPTTLRHLPGHLVRRANTDSLERCSEKVTEVQPVPCEKTVRTAGDRRSQNGLVLRWQTQIRTVSHECGDIKSRLQRFKTVQPARPLGGKIASRLLQHPGMRCQDRMSFEAIQQTSHRAA